MAEQDIVERAQRELATYDRVGKQTSSDLIVEALKLRQQLAEARETMANEAAALIEANSFHKTADGYALEPRMQGDRYGLAYATAIRALPHPDREGERE